MRTPAPMKRIGPRDRALFNVLFALQHYLPKNDFVREQKELVRRRIAEAIRTQGRGQVFQVDRVKAADLSPEEFRRHYLGQGVPLLIEGAAKEWACARQWGFDQFRARYGHEKIKLVQRKGLSDDDYIDEREFTEELGFGEFLDQVLSGGRKYMRFSPLLEKFPELRHDFDASFFRKMSGNRLGVTYQLFIGGAGTFTPLHNAMTPFFFVNVTGVKRWALIPTHYLAILDPDADGFGYNHTEADLDAPDLERFPGFDCIDRLETVMQPGDVLYNPSWMWHCVKNEAPTIGVRCGFIHPKGMVEESLTLTFIRLFAARNPTMLEALYYAVVKPNLAERDFWLLTPKLFRG